MNLPIEHISASTLKKWAECPFRFYLEKVLKLGTFEGNIYTTFGSSIHKSNEESFLNYKENGEFLTVESMVDIFEKTFLLEIEKVPSAKSQYEEFRTQGVAILHEIIDSVVEYLPDDFEIIAVEHHINTPLTGFLYDDVLTSPITKELNFLGYVDLIVHSPSKNKYFIIDWKTTSWGWGQDKKRNKDLLAQLVLYKYYFAKERGFTADMFRKIELDYVLLKRTAKSNRVEFFKYSAGEKTIKDALGRINGLCYNLETEKYFKNRTSCRYCPAKGTEYCV